MTWKSVLIPVEVALQSCERFNEIINSHATMCFFIFLSVSIHSIVELELTPLKHASYRFYQEKQAFRAIFMRLRFQKKRKNKVEVCKHIYKTRYIYIYGKLKTLLYVQLFTLAPSFHVNLAKRKSNFLTGMFLN